MIIRSRIVVECPCWYFRYYVYVNFSDCVATDLEYTSCFWNRRWMPLLCRIRPFMHVGYVWESNNIPPCMVRIPLLWEYFYLSGISHHSPREFSKVIDIALLFSYFPSTIQFAIKKIPFFDGDVVQSAQRPWPTITLILQFNLQHLNSV